MNQRLKNFFEDNYSSEIFASILELIDDKNISDFSIDYIVCEDKFALKFKAYLNISYEVIDSYENEKQHYEQVLVTCDAKFEQTSIICSNFRAEPLRNVKLKYRLDENFMFIGLTDKEYEELALNFLDEYYPKYKEVDFINIEELLQNVGCKLEYRRLSTDDSIFGCVCLEDKKMFFYDKDGIAFREKVCKGTILIDKEMHDKRNSLYTIVFSIIHEIVHYVYHQKYFWFNYLKNELLICPLKVENNKIIYWLEKQTNMITASIILPKTQLLYDWVELKNNCSSKCEADKMRYTIEKISYKRKVTKESIIIRLNKLNAKNINGLYEYVDGKYVKPYLYSNEINKDGNYITFSISLQDFAYQYVMDFSFREIIQTGKYVYVDSHLCLKDNRYMQYNKHGILELTDYARDNIEKCCLAFEFKFKFDKFFDDFVGLDDCILYRSKTKAKKYELWYFPTDSISEIKQSKNYTKKYERDASAFNLKTLKEVIKELRNNRNLTQESLAACSGLSIKTISQFDKKIELKNLVLICVGLKLPSSLSYKLLEMGGYSLMANTPDNLAYKMIIDSCTNRTSDEIKKIYETFNL